MTKVRNAYRRACPRAALQQLHCIIIKFARAPVKPVRHTKYLKDKIIKREMQRSTVLCCAAKEINKE